MNLQRRGVGTLVALVALALLLPAASATARPTGADRDGRPNILVVMTDDMAATDLAMMPNVQRLLAKQGTTFDNAITSFPLCCPSRATFITGQYAHNHGVVGNFSPYGWYGMQDRGNTLPAWLQDAGYRDRPRRQVAQRLRGARRPRRDSGGVRHLARTARRIGLRLLQLRDELRWRAAQLGRPGVRQQAGRVRARSRSTTSPTRSPRSSRGSRSSSDRAPYSYWGDENPDDYSPDVTGEMTEKLVRAERKKRKPFFIWWSVAAPHREDVSTTLMGRPGPDPRPAPRYADEVSSYSLPQPPSFNEPDISDKPSPVTDAAPSDVAGPDRAAGARLPGPSGRADGGRRPRRRPGQDASAHTDQLKNTVIMFLSDNGWLQGEHRDHRRQVPPLRGVAAGAAGHPRPGRARRARPSRGQVSNIDFAPTLLDFADAKAGRTMDGISLLPALRKPKKRPDRALEIEALEPLFEREHSGQRVGPALHRRAHRPATPTSSGPRRARRSSTTARPTPTSSTTSPTTPPTRRSKADLAAKLAALRNCAGAACNAVAP